MGVRITNQGCQNNITLLIIVKRLTKYIYFILIIKKVIAKELAYKVVKIIYVNYKILKK